MAAKRKSRKSANTATASTPEWMMDAMNQVWLAGLGAISKARQSAPGVLEELVAEGARTQAGTRESIEKLLGGVVGDMKSKFGAGFQTLNSGVDQVRSHATGALDDLEAMFQTRVHRALTQLGVPSAEDVERLSQRVELLNSSVNKLANKRIAPVRRRAA